MVSFRNEILAALPASERDALAPHLTSVSLQHGAVLHETGGSIERVYFPESGAVSLVVDLSSGEIIESALVGCDGAIGSSCALQHRAALNKAMVQIEGTAWTLSADALGRCVRPELGARATARPALPVRPCPGPAIGRLQRGAQPGRQARALAVARP